MNELKKQLPLISIIIAILFAVTVIAYQLEPLRSVFYLVLLFCPCVVLAGKKHIKIDG